MSELEDMIKDLRKPEVYENVWVITASLDDLVALFQAYTDRAVTLGRIEELAKLFDFYHPDPKTFNYLKRRMEKLQELKAITISVRDGGETSSQRGQDNG